MLLPNNDKHKTSGIRKYVHNDRKNLLELLLVEIQISELEIFSHLYEFQFYKVSSISEFQFFNSELVSFIKPTLKYLLKFPCSFLENNLVHYIVMESCKIIMKCFSIMLFFRSYEI